MRRPSAIPASAPPVEPDDVREAEQERVSRRGEGDVPESAVSSESAEGAAEPIPLARRASDPDDGDLGSASDAGAEGGGPLTARDLWQATRARRRALRSEIRRFTQRSRRRRIGWVVGAAIALLIVGGSVGAAYSPLFAVQTITVQGAASLKPGDVQKALADQLGRPLALVDPSAVKAALVRFPLIETYRLEAHPPHDLVVRIVERTPVGVIPQKDGRYTVVDVAGVVLSTAEQRPAGYALIETPGGTGTPAFSAVGTALRSLPAELRAQVDTASASTPDDIVLQLAGGAKIVWGSADQSAEKNLALQALMKANPAAASYDVSSPGVGVVG